MKLLALAVAILPQIVATNPVTAIGIPTDIQTFPVNGFYGTPLKYRAKLTTRSTGPKPGPTWVDVDGVSLPHLCGEVTWAPTGSGNWTAMCEVDVARLDMKVGTSTVKYKVVKSDLYGHPTQDGYVGSSASATVTIAKVPVLFDLGVQPLKSDVSKRSFKIEMQAKLGLNVPGRPLNVLVGGKTTTMKSGDTLEVPVTPNSILDMSVVFAGDDNLLAGSQKWLVPVNDAKPCAIEVDVSATKTKPGVGELTAKVYLHSKYAFPSLGVAGKNVKLVGFGSTVTLAEMTTDATGHATKTVTLSGGMALWLARPLFASFGGDATTPMCISGSLNAQLDVF